jgi:phage/plasmid primase-like uncharacterized protein
VDDELDRFKRINLSEYAASRGYRLIGSERTRNGWSGGSTGSSLLMRHPITDDKIVIRVEGDGHWTYFSVRDDRDNGTIIDFVQRRGALTLGTVREELRRWSGQERPAVPREHFRPSLDVQRRDRTAVRDAFARAQIASNSTYLNSRGIRPETLCSERFRGTWRVDDRDNLLFPHRDGPGLDSVCGFEKKSRGFTRFATGGKKTIWVSNARVGDTRIVFAEAVIDVFSYHQLHPDDHACYASTGGSFGGPQAQYIARAISNMGPSATIVIATDNDDAGEKLAAKIADLAGMATMVRDRSPVGKDWNDCLQERERDYIETLGSRSRGPER